MSLLWFKKSTDQTSQVNRYRIKLHAYKYEIVYKAGKTYANTDALSRSSVEEMALALKGEGMQTRAGVGKITLPNYRENRLKRPNKCYKNKNTQDSIEIDYEYIVARHLLAYYL